MPTRPRGHRTPPTPRPSGGARYPTSWQQRSRQEIARHLADHGPICPGHQVPPHPVDPTDLTLDHTTPRAHGGTHHGPTSVLCRRCNSAKNDTTNESPS